ncbi:MAG: DJ-1/PfpI family protein [Bacteroidales bacterium]|nr:DJ-1/PfpI family protein [Bacteroidales bacterium]
MKKAIILLADGFEEVEALGPRDVLRRGGVEVKLISIGEEYFVESSHGVTVVADLLLTEGVGDFDLLMLPGGMPGSKSLRDSEAVIELVKKAGAEGKVVSAICAAPIALAKAGVLNGRRATCFPGFEAEISAGGATHTGERVTVDGKVITGIGAGAALEFGVALLSSLEGEATAQKVRQQMIML